jgi:hypothetical protein
VDKRQICQFQVFSKANFTASFILFVSIKLYLSSINFLIFIELSGNKTRFLMLYFSNSKMSFSNSYHLSVHHKKIVQILSQNVFIASIVLSGVVEIASSINVIHL